MSGEQLDLNPVAAELHIPLPDDRLPRQLAGERNQGTEGTEKSRWPDRNMTTAANFVT